MIEVIWKYTIGIHEPTTHQIPEGGTIRSLQVQQNQIQIWIAVDPDKKEELREFYCFATGEVIEDSEQYEFIGTVQLGQGSLVLHVHERKLPTSNKFETVKPYGAS